jgi:hypothetical protein
MEFEDMEMLGFGDVKIRKCEDELIGRCCDIN